MSDVIQSLLDETFALQHYGVKGQKWGHRNYQNPDGTYTELGKERRRVGYKKDASDADEDSAVKISGKAYKDMTRRERRAAKRKARHNEAERRERREFNRDKADAMQRGDLDFINKHLDKFSNDEIAQAVNRYKTMQIVRDLDAADKAKRQKTADHYIDKAVKMLNRVGDVTDAVTRIRDRVNDSNKKSAESKKAQLAYDKELNPDKYKKEKTKDELEKAALDLQKARDEARKAKNAADQMEQTARLAKLNADKNDPDYLEAKEKAKKAKLDAEEAERKVRDVEKSIKEDKEVLKEIERKKKEDKKAAKKAAKEKEEDEEYDNLMKETNDFLDSWRKKKEQNNIPAENDDYEDVYTRLQDDYWINSYFSGKSPAQSRSIIKRVLGMDKLKDYESYKPSKNRTYELEDLNKESRNAIKKIAKEKPKIGDYAQDKQWTKDMKKHDSRYIDKWVEDMKKKYMKERNMSAKAAEAKAEEYVDAWIDAYDEGRILV